ncbi:MAG: SRPBCC family protein [Myxococcales bacterium]|nr:SRPBCC family protein [Myxococcales bacterium]
MYSVTHAADVLAPPAAVWRLVADLEADWNPLFARSQLVGAARRGVGAERQSWLAGEDGRFDERVIDWAEGSWLTTEVTSTTLPLASAKLTLGVEPCGAGRSTAIVVVEYEPQREALSRFGGVFRLRARLCKDTQRMIEGLKRAAEGATRPDVSSGVAGRVLGAAR